MSTPKPWNPLPNGPAAAAIRAIFRTPDRRLTVRDFMDITRHDYSAASRQLNSMVRAGVLVKTDRHTFALAPDDAIPPSPDPAEPITGA